MFIYHCFILLTIIILTKQIELSLSLDLLSSSLTPISYIRSGDNSIVLSNDDSSLIYNLETGAKDNYDIFHFYRNIYKLFYVVSEINIHSSISAPKETKV